MASQCIDAILLSVLLTLLVSVGLTVLIICIGSSAYKVGVADGASGKAKPE